MSKQFTEEEKTEIAFRMRKIQSDPQWEERIDMALSCHQKLIKHENLTEIEKETFLRNYALIRDIAYLKPYAPDVKLPLSPKKMKACDALLQFVEKPALQQGVGFFAKLGPFHLNDLKNLFNRLGWEIGQGPSKRLR